MVDFSTVIAIIALVVTVMFGTTAFIFGILDIVNQRIDEKLNQKLNKDSKKK